MKNYTSAKLGVFALIAVLLAAFAHFYVPTSAAQPGVDTDPVVTRSFVETRIAQLSAEIELLRGIIANISPGSLPNVTPAPTQTPSPSPVAPSTANLSQDEEDELFALVMYYFETVYGERLDAALRNIPGPAGEPHSSVFTVLNPQAGQTITFNAGTEFILRSGRAVALTGPNNGIPNVTAGADIMNGQNIEHNHLMIIPVTDGRGIVFQTEAWLMVRGGYTIVGG
ncbi:MAG: hypothetical protein FWE27_02110 [Defluviitaleaceae bacterium]|nr:hypothetical protein [Defluviitaleaceae bacterium]